MNQSVQWNVPRVFNFAQLAKRNQPLRSRSRSCFQARQKRGTSVAHVVSEVTATPLWQKNNGVWGAPSFEEGGGSWYPMFKK